GCSMGGLPREKGPSRGGPFSPRLSERGWTSAAGLRAVGDARFGARVHHRDARHVLAGDAAIRLVGGGVARPDAPRLAVGAGRRARGGVTLVPGATAVVVERRRRGVGAAPLHA